MNCTDTSKNIQAPVSRKNETNPCGRTPRRSNQQKQTADNNKRCLLSERKSPTPKTRALIEKYSYQSKNEKNHVKSNIEFVKNITFKEKRHIMQDSNNGHCQDSVQAGLELRYVFKKEYGKTPRYIRRNRYLIEKMKKVEQDANKVPEPSMRYVEDEEKDAVLDGLKANLKEAEKQFLSLPIVTDTLSKRNRKMYLENLMLKLQQDIETLERHDIIVLND
ncbi:enkurin [Planococcus citri]|uniref:enkurin n=1 Tax=Planococcus citri TaxID=170843 RepID=UPI0031F9E362